MNLEQLLSQVKKEIGGENNFVHSKYQNGILNVTVKDGSAVDLNALKQIPEVAKAELYRSRVRITVVNDDSAKENNMAKNYSALAEDIIAKIGGKENIKAHTHCVTRLRFNLMDESKANTEAIKAIPGVLGVSVQGGQYQVIIGADVANVYQAIVDLIGESRKTNENVPEEEKAGKKKNPVTVVFDTLSGTFVQIIPAILAAGMISAILTLLTTFGLVDAESPTYTVFSAIQSAVFYFLPLLTGYACAKKLGSNPAVGLALGAVLCYSTINGAEGLSVFGLPIMTVTYSNSVFPVILGVILMYFVEKGLTKIIPSVLKSLVVPTITLLIGVIATLLVLGPIGTLLGNGMYAIVSLLSEYAGWFAPALIALLYPIMVFTGMHYSLMPFTMIGLSSVGYDPLLMVAGFVGNICEGGAGLATALYEKESDKKSTAFGAGISALCGVTEPALFGVTLPNRKTLISVMAGGFCGALIAGIFGCRAYNFVGGLPSLPMFIDPAGSPGNLIVALISIAVGFVVTFVLTYILNAGGRKRNA